MKFDLDGKTWENQSHSEKDISLQNATGFCRKESQKLAYGIYQSGLDFQSNGQEMIASPRIRDL